MRWALLVLLGICLAPILIIAYQMAFVNGYYDSSRCGTQRYVRHILTADLSEYSYDEWEVGRRWEQAHGRDCPEDDWQLVKAREPARLFGDWPELNRMVAQQYDLSAIAALIKKRADPNNTDRYGRNARHWAYARTSQSLIAISSCRFSSTQVLTKKPKTKTGSGRFSGFLPLDRAELCPINLSLNRELCLTGVPAFPPKTLANSAICRGELCRLREPRSAPQLFPAGAFVDPRGAYRAGDRAVGGGGSMIVSVRRY